MIYIDRKGRLTTDPDRAVGEVTDPDSVMLMELAADHEERICLIEMGVEL